ncbi:MAG: hypothetical protein KAY37_15420 [Phycisphaerae bacterium]|nr:hypothetical protein [Phycisphaerae bacterium]
MAIDFGEEGCSSPVTAEQWVVNGNVSIVARPTLEADIDFEDLSIAEQAVVGGMHVVFEDLPDGIRLVGTSNIDTAGVGTTQGNISLDISEGGVLLFTSADLLVDDGTVLVSLAGGEPFEHQVPGIAP